MFVCLKVIVRNFLLKHSYLHPSWHLLVVIQQSKHQKNVWNLSKTNKKTPERCQWRILLSLFLTLSRFHILLWCLIADFEQVNTTWDTVIAIIAVFFLFSNESKVQGPVNSSSTCGDSLQLISNFPRSSCILIFLLGIAMCFH